MNVCVKCKDKGKKCKFGNCTVRNPEPDVKAFDTSRDIRNVQPSYLNRGWLLEPCKH
jgi:hypothetical protein